MRSQFIILFLLIISLDLASQDWKHYPYAPDNSLISFPKDEGYHGNEKTEWWYTFAKLKGKETGIDYTVMFTFFYRDTLIFDGLRIFNISNENTKEFFSDAKPVNYKANSQEYLDIEAEIYGQNRVETWKTKVDSNGMLIPFTYNIKAKAPFGAINLDFDVVKRPLILADSGFLFQGVKNYTYYYSFTEIDVSGLLTLNGTTEEVEGTAWFDKQYGNFHPEVEEKYEWLSLKLSNGIDINLWEIFNEKYDVPEKPEYKQFNCYINDTTTFNTSDFKIERLEYFYSPDSARIYCKKFLITEPTLDLEIIVEIANPNCEPGFPFEFYEGPLNISGKVNGTDILGFGFGELLHTYDHPVLKFDYPTDIWNLDSLIKWKVTNPDFGRPLVFDLYSKTAETNYNLIESGIKDSVYMLNPMSFSQDSSYRFLLISYSVDSFFRDTIVTNFFKPLFVNYINGEKINIYPTPFGRNLFLEARSGILVKNTRVILVSDKNQIVFEKKLKRDINKMEFDFNNLPNGLYILYIINNASVFSKKIVHVNH